MKHIDDMMALVPIKEIKELKNADAKKDEIIEFYREVLKNVELFLTFWYQETTEFGKIKDNFNEGDFPCEIRIKNNRVKIKIDKYNEENTDSN